MNGRIGFIQIKKVGNNQVQVTERGLAPVGVTSLDFANLTCATLPVELTAFKAIAEKAAIKLMWETASEENNAGFEVERSENGKDFKKLAFVQGNGTTLEAQTYQFADQTARKGQTYYYRLRQIDFDGRFDYSDIVTALILSDKIEVAEFAPNPVSGSQAQLNIALPNAGEVSLQVFDVAGKLLHSNLQDLASGAHTLNVDVNNFLAGTYFVKLTTNGESVYRK
ncbi:MAG: T9SS type A sorting domain-containing protein, partial [Saprospiraceae bacterium]|nr:T9SS type A sorting domain-containing protein [Saprospiraceae bacterium]